MHQSSMEKMQDFVARYLETRRDEALQILDLGSLDVNGTYRPLFDAPGWAYTGVDLSPGPNVDLVLSDPYRWRILPARRFDVIVSGQTFEHIEFFWVTLQQMVRVLRPGGLICIIAPSRGYEHRYPVDCWRFYPDGFRALAAYVGLDLLEVSAQWEAMGYTGDDSDVWGDAMAVYRRPLRWPWRQRVRLALRRRVDAWGV